MNSDFESCLERHILVLDGATATLLSRHGSPCSDLLCLDRPATVLDAHRRYIEAGADIITTNTFNANTLSLRRYGLSHRWACICREAVALAYKAACASDRRCFVAGCLGACAASHLYTSTEITRAYQEQAQVLIENGADLLMLESVYDLDGAIAAAEGIIRAMEQSKHLPLMLSAIPARNGCLPSGHTLGKLVRATEHFGVTIYGLNCGYGISAMLPFIQQLSDITPAHISFHPNAGLPDSAGRYADTPQLMADTVSSLLRTSRIDIVGGCCGTTPEHIRRIAMAIRSSGTAEPDRLS